MITQAGVNPIPDVEFNSTSVSNSASVSSPISVEKRAREVHEKNPRSWIRQPWIMQWKRKQWIAALLSVSVAGLGHLHAGQPRRAVLACLSWILVGVAGAFLAAYGFYGLIIALGLTLATLLFFAWDAAKTMNRPTVRVRPRWWMYLAFVLLFLVTHHVSKRFYRSVAYVIPADSMSPALIPGDHVMVDRFAYRAGGQPQMGDIVVFRPPGLPGALYVKRVAAVPGDTVETVGHVTLVNDRPISVLDEVTDEMFQAGEEADFPEEIVPDEHFFVVGDNLENSHDSRRFGFIPRESIVGRVVYVYASLPDGETSMPDFERVGVTVR